jgi:hypothetical protein
MLSSDCTAVPRVIETTPAKAGLLFIHCYNRTQNKYREASIELKKKMESNFKLQNSSVHVVSTA